MSMMLKRTNPTAAHTAIMMTVVVSIGVGGGIGVTKSKESCVAM